MNKEKFLEMLELYVLDELSEKDREFVENAMMESDEYRKEYESRMKFHYAVLESKPEELDENTLQNSRKVLFNTIDSETKSKTAKSNTKLFLDFIFFGNHKTAYAMATTLLVGFFLGYIIFNSSTVNVLPKTNPNEVDLDAFDEKDINISNIRFQNPFGGEGDVEISFDAIKPISYKGKVDDPQVQRLLAAALTESDNAGVRIRTVNTISAQTSDFALRDPKIKVALINALKTDENDGVRREALNALTKYPYSEDLRDAFLFALSNDLNPGIKVAAINALAEMKMQGRSIDNELRNVIDNELSTGKDNFIKLKAASLIQEVK